MDRSALDGCPLDRPGLDRSGLAVTASPRIAVRRATPITLTLALGLAAAGATALLLTDRGAVLAQDPPIAPAAAFLLLVAAFGAAELGLLHVEFRHQAHSFSLSGVAL